jgi:hypothetical protein
MPQLKARKISNLAAAHLVRFALLEPKCDWKRGRKERVSVYVWVQFPPP